MLRNSVQTAARFLWNLSSVGLRKGDQVSRYYMYGALRRHAGEVNLGKQVLSISHSGYLCKLFGASDEDITDASYPEYNICDLKWPSESFSAVVSDQVLEHVSCTPECAVREVYRVLKPGGFAIHTTCFMLPYHGSPDHQDVNNGDYWRFTPSGLALLHEKYSRVITADGWGNPLLPVIGALGLTRLPVPEAPWHPGNMLARLNRRSYASMVWVIAQK